MYAISTAAFVSILALVSSLVGVVQAHGPRAQCTTWYWTKQSDTCNHICSFNDVAMNVLKGWNPNLNCDLEPLPVQKLCVDMKAPICSITDEATTTTCDDLMKKHDISRDLFYQYNDDVDKQCDNLIVKKSYCVAIF